MKIGLIPAAEGAIGGDGSYVAEYAATAEAAGFDSVWIGEHPALPVHAEQEYPGTGEGLAAPSSAPLPDPLEWLAFAGACTTTLLLGTAILLLPLHNPVVMAKRVATLDRLTGGRVLLGIGVGWNRQEFVACGADWESRGPRCDEAIEILRALWRDEAASYAGDHYAFEAVYSSPSPVNGTVPILIGSNGPVGARRAGRTGDGYLPFERDHERLAEQISIMRSSAEAAGRDPDDIEVTALGGTSTERVRLLTSLRVSRMLLFSTDIATLPALGERLHNVIADVGG